MTNALGGTLIFRNKLEKGEFVVGMRFKNRDSGDIWQIINVSESIGHKIQLQNTVGRHETLIKRQHDFIAKIKERVWIPQF